MYMIFKFFFSFFLAFPILLVNAQQDDKIENLISKLTIEEKISITKENLFLFYNFLLKNKALNLYPSRNINSIYFDNELFQMFYDSEEGVVPRKKIRTRNYNNLTNYQVIFFIVI